MKKLLLTLATALLGAAMLLGIVACTDTDELPPTDDAAWHNQWQASIRDDVKVLDMVMPGTHDSGTSGMILFAETQKQTIYEQLVSGVRYMDIRVYRTSTDDLLIFHGPIRSMKFTVVVADIKRFISENPSEVLVLDFQHFEKKAEPLVAAILQDELNMSNTAFPNTGDIATVTMGDMRTARSNYIVAWGSSALPVNVGIRSRTSTLRSPYNEKKHTADTATLINHFDRYNLANDNSRLFVLQAQRTSPSIESLYHLEKKFIVDCNNYIYNLRNDSSALAKTNIIMRDFINMKSETIDLILALNITKNNVKTTAISMFSTKTNM